MVELEGSLDIYSLILKAMEETKLEDIQVKKRTRFAIFVLVIAAVLLVFIPASYCYYVNSGPVILMYHHLAPSGTYSGTDNVNNKAILKVEHFEAQMKWLWENDYTTLFMSEFTKLLSEGGSFPKKCVVITFDDGYESSYQYAQPILKKYGLKANLSVIVRPTERRDEYPDHTPYQPDTLRHVTFDQLREMVSSGNWEIGSHTYDSHSNINIDDYGKVGPALVNYRYHTVDDYQETHQEYLLRITTDLLRSRNVLKAELGVAPAYFAYPGGYYNKSVIEVAKQVGFTSAVTVNNGGVHDVNQLYTLPRHNVDNDMTVERLAKLLQYK